MPEIVLVDVSLEALEAAPKMVVVKKVFATKATTEEATAEMIAQEKLISQFPEVCRVW